MEVFKILINALWAFLNIHIVIDGFTLKLYYLPVFIWFVTTILKMIYGPAIALTPQHIEERNRAEGGKRIMRDISKGWNSKGVMKK